MERNVLYKMKERISTDKTEEKMRWSHGARPGPLPDDSFLNFTKHRKFTT